MRTSNAATGIVPDMTQGIHTGRLYLRPYREGDGAWYCEMSRRNHEHLARYEPENLAMGITTTEQAESAMQDLAQAFRDRECFFLGAFERVTGEFVAQVYVGPRNWALPEFEAGYFADRDHEGKGYVTEALGSVLDWVFTDLGAHRVRIECDDTNVRSAAVAERCGFKLEGHLRQDKRNEDGTITGTLVYGLLRHEHASLAMH